MDEKEFIKEMKYYEMGIFEAFHEGFKPELIDKETFPKLYTNVKRLYMLYQEFSLIEFEIFDSI